MDNNKLEIKWMLYNKMLLPSVPPHNLREMDIDKIKMTLKKSKAWLARWTTDFDCGYQTEWWYVIKDGNSDLDSLKSKYKSEIRKGLKNCYVKKVDPVELADELYNVYISAFSRYKKADKPIDKDTFSRDCFNNKFKGNIDYFGVFLRENNKLVGYSVNVVYDDCVSYSSIKYIPDFLRNGISHALIFEMNCYYLNVLKKKYVLDGSRSIRHDTNIQDYLIKTFGFRKAYCKLNIEYKPIVKIIINCLYPFRNFIRKYRDYSIFNNVYSLLIQEQIRRTFLIS